ncbi:glycosyltransferase family 4 protein [Pedobacter sp. Leaf250]|uniref:glycosyltransferase family 4 protein n=1 Tax=Pedobacter sp. Leaf250 TaxID=2876559 RepID=UPI001E496AD6|nr:glycosyltransferase family 4 protein [Pedobacter sp. Leaf250]
MKYIVVHAGRRDDYQVALALAENDSLKYLVTDFYVPFDSILFGVILRSMPDFVLSKLSKRYKKGLSSRFTVISFLSIFFEFLLVLTKNVKYSTLKDKALGDKARKLSIKYNVPILSMNTYAKYAFEQNPINPKVLFQFHPHTTFVKNLLEDEMKINPLSKISILQEYEFSVSEGVLSNLSQEIYLADHIICASSVTAKSLKAEGINEETIKVIPYGVELSKFKYKCRELFIKDSVFKIVFVGSLNQRKGITYLLNAIKTIPNIELNIIGRGIFDENLIRDSGIKINIYKNIPHSEMISLLHESHCFVLPSLIEGFGQVILEAMSTGIPVIASENTIASDIVVDGRNGFLVPIRNSQVIKEKIQYLIHNPKKINEIGKAGFITSQKLSWDTFRMNLISHLQSIS